MELSAELRERARHIKLAVFDVDGVLTDGRLHFSANGHETKSFHSQDGLGMKYLQRYGVTVAIITGRRSAIVDNRMKELGVLHVYQGCDNKAETFNLLLNALKLQPGQAAYIGDDLVDVPVMDQCGLAVTVPNAHFKVAESAHWITPRAGGYGAGRDFCDMLLTAQDRFTELMRDIAGRAK